MCTKGSFPRTYSKQKKTCCFTPKSLLPPSLCGLCLRSGWVSSREKGPFLDTQQPRPSGEDPGLQMVGGWKGVRRRATFACLAALLFRRPQLLAPARDTILGWDVITLISSCSLSELHTQLLFSLSDPFHIHAYSSRQLQTLPCSRSLVVSGY